MNKEIIAKRLINLRGERTQLEVAKALGISQSTYGYTFDTNLQIYINGVLADVDDYTIELTEDTDSGYKIVFNNTLNADTRIEVVMIS